MVEAVVAIAAATGAGRAALIGFGVDSAIEVSSAVALLWRRRSAGPRALFDERSRAERRAAAWRSSAWVPGRLIRQQCACVGRVKLVLS